MILHFGHITLELTVRDINFIVKSINWTLINESTLESIDGSFFYDRESSYYLQNEIAQFIRQAIEEQHFSLESNGPFSATIHNEINPGEFLSTESIQSLINNLQQNATRL